MTHAGHKRHCLQIIGMIHRDRYPQMIHGDYRLDKWTEKDMDRKNEIYGSFLQDMKEIGPDAAAVSGIRSALEAASGRKTPILRIVTASSAAAALVVAVLLFKLLMPSAGHATAGQQVLSASIYPGKMTSEDSRLYAAYRNSLERRQYILENHIPDRQE